MSSGAGDPAEGSASVLPCSQSVSMYRSGTDSSRPARGLRPLRLAQGPLGRGDVRPSQKCEKAQPSAAGATSAAARDSSPPRSGSATRRVGCSAPPRPGRWPARGPAGGRRRSADPGRTAGRCRLTGRRRSQRGEDGAQSSSRGLGDMERHGGSPLTRDRRECAGGCGRRCQQRGGGGARAATPGADSRPLRGVYTTHVHGRFPLVDADNPVKTLARLVHALVFHGYFRLFAPRFGAATRPVISRRGRLDLVGVFHHAAGGDVLADPCLRNVPEGVGASLVAKGGPHGRYGSARRGIIVPDASAGAACHPREEGPFDGGEGRGGGV